jgi:hypothetical protein
MKPVLYYRTGSANHGAIIPGNVCRMAPEAALVNHDNLFLPTMPHRFRYILSKTHAIAGIPLPKNRFFHQFLEIRKLCETFAGNGIIL